MSKCSHISNKDIIIIFSIICIFNSLFVGSTELPTRLWIDKTDSYLPKTAQWTNRVELSDLNSDGLVDILFANGGNYSKAGTPEMNRVFLNQGAKKVFKEITEKVFGNKPDISRVIKIQDVNNDGINDIMVGNTFQSQSRLFLGSKALTYIEVTSTHLPSMPLSVGDLEFADFDSDGDLDMVLADWGAGHNMTNGGGVTRLWLNDGSGKFVDATQQLPARLIGFSWDLESIDFDNDGDLDIVVSCKRCGGGSLFVNDGKGFFTENLKALPQYANNYDYEVMDLNADGFVDMITVNDGEIVDGLGNGKSWHRREHILVNKNGKGFVDATHALWPDSENIGEDDNNVVFLDFDSDGDADFILSSLTGADRLLINGGKGQFTLANDVFVGAETPGTLSLMVADINGDHKLDVVQAQGEHPTADEERIFIGVNNKVDTSKPHIQIISTLVTNAGDSLQVIARIHDYQSPLMLHQFNDVSIQWQENGKTKLKVMRWYGEYLWRNTIPLPKTSEFTICATDRANNQHCKNTKFK